jgi:iron complex transport system ATP-binding protein
MESRGSGSVLSARDVTFRVAGVDSPLVRNVSLDVFPGDFVCIVGPNGAGKSTLLSLLGGAMPTSGGQILLLGRNLREWERPRIASHVSLLSQFAPPVFEYTVREVVAMGRAPHQDAWLRMRPEDERAVDEALARWELEALASRAVATLSGGEQKRVALARIFAQATEVMLLDEPGSSLDLRQTISLHEHIASEVRAREVACVAVTHDLAIAARFATRIVLFAQGTIQAEGTADEVLTEARVREVFGAEVALGTHQGMRWFVPIRTA